MAHILIVEQNEKLRSLLGEHLQSRGYKVTGVEDGPAAARFMRQERPDLLVIDQEVSMGGLKTARLLRLHPAYQQIPILLLLDSQKAGEQLVAEGKRLNLNSFLLKPCTAAALEAKIRKELRQRLGQISMTEVRAELAQLTELPVLLPNHRKMLSLLSHEDSQVEVSELIRTIETDHGLTTRILRVCHSAYYGFRGNTIEGATTFLGIDKIRRIIQSSIVFDLFQAGASPQHPSPVLEIWKHSLACGLIVEASGRRVKGRDHFIAGMLHDIGKIILFLRFRDYFEEVKQIAQEEEKSIFQAERELMGMAHTEIGHELAKKWDLPPTIATAIAFHHQPSATLQHKRLASLVHLGDLLARTLEIGSGGDQQAIRMDPEAQPLAKYAFEVASQKEAILAEVESMIGEGQVGR